MRGEAERAVELALGAVAATERMEAGRDTVESRLSAGRALAAAGGARTRWPCSSARPPTRAGRAPCSSTTPRPASCAGSARASRPRRGAPHAAAGLTERERDIAGLVSAGRSNKEVAASLFLSEKTIEHHLSRIYAKLGVRSRVELANAEWESAA